METDRPSTTQTLGPHATAVLIDGDHNTVTIQSGTQTLPLVPRDRLKRAPKTDRHLLLTELRATTLVGRDSDLAALQAWLATPHPISARCLTGRGGSGKTRSDNTKGNERRFLLISCLVALTKGASAALLGTGATLAAHLLRITMGRDQLAGYAIMALATPLPVGRRGLSHG